MQPFNPRWLRFVKLESRDLYFGDPLPLLNGSVQEILDCDRLSADVEGFKVKCDQIIRNRNKELLPYGITLKLQKGSLSEKHGRPYALRVERCRVSTGEIGKTLVEKYVSIQKSKTMELQPLSI